MRARASVTAPSGRRRARPSDPYTESGLTLQVAREGGTPRGAGGPDLEIDDRPAPGGDRQARPAGAADQAHRNGGGMGHLLEAGAALGRGGGGAARRRPRAPERRR